MDAMQTADPDPVSDLIVAKTQDQELGSSDVAVLPFSDRGDRRVQSAGYFSD
jgi:hypothetical protein